MNLSDVRRRITRFENSLQQLRLGESGHSGRNNSETTEPLEQLHMLYEEAGRIKQKAEGQGDYRTALAAIRYQCHILEFRARLKGDLKENMHLNVVNVQLSPDTAARIAQTYLDRHRTPELQ
jgi:hypothetical protein